MSFSCLPKVALIPWEGDMKGVPIISMYNPTELSFDKEVDWGDTKNGTGENCPKPSFSSGKPINLSMEFFYDFYEQKLDVRPVVATILHLCEAQTFKDAETGNEVTRPPKVQFVWRDANPLGTGSAYFAVLTKVSAKYTMFLEDGTPCRASVTVSCQQVDPLEGADKFTKSTSIVMATAGLTAAAIENMGGRGDLEGKGGKIEDPSTWPPFIVVPIK